MSLFSVQQDEKVVYCSRDFEDPESDPRRQFQNNRRFQVFRQRNERPSNEPEAVFVAHKVEKFRPSDCSKQNI